MLLAPPYPPTGGPPTSVVRHFSCPHACSGSKLTHESVCNRDADICEAILWQLIDQRMTSPTKGYFFRALQSKRGCAITHGSAKDDSTTLGR